MRPAVRATRARINSRYPARPGWGSSRPSKSFSMSRGWCGRASSLRHRLRA